MEVSLLQTLLLLTALGACVSFTSHLSLYTAPVPQQFLSAALGDATPEWNRDVSVYRELGARYPIDDSKIESDACVSRRALYRVGEEPLDYLQKEEAGRLQCMRGLDRLQTLGGGAFGSVWRVRVPGKGDAPLPGSSLVPGKEYAVKATRMVVDEMDFGPPGGMAETEVCMQDFAAEDLGIAPRIHAVWQCGAHMYIAMNLMGQTYKQMLEEKIPQGAESVTENLSVIAQRSVVGLHEVLLEHNYRQIDAHSENMAVTLDGRMRLLDFGAIGVVPEKDRQKVQKKKQILKQKITTFHYFLPLGKLRCTASDWLCAFLADFDNYELGSNARYINEKAV